jgi:hypothetical protein
MAFGSKGGNDFSFSGAGLLTDFNKITVQHSEKIELLKYNFV